MADFSRLPYYQGSISVFANKLRALLFSSQKESADYFQVDRSRIARYENETDDEPPLGYITYLAKLVAERMKSEPTIEQFLFREVNKAQEDCYQMLPFVDWGMLCDYADTYLEQQYERSLYKQLGKKWNKSDRDKWSIRLRKRLNPSSNHELIGIDDYIEELFQLLISPDPPWIINVVGLGGIGKTSLAYAIACKVIHKQKFDDLAWISARQESYDPPKPSILKANDPQCKWHLRSAASSTCTRNFFGI